MRDILIIAGIVLVFLWFLALVYYSSKKSRRKQINTIFYVAPWGDDHNLGNPESPWRSIQYAVDQLKPGDQLILFGGTYIEYITIRNSGTQEKPVTITAKTGEEVVLDGMGLVWKYAINIEFGASYLTIEGLKISNYIFGIGLWGQNTHVKLKGLDISDCGTALQIISGEKLVIENCSFHNNKGPGMAISPGPINDTIIKNTRSSYNEGTEVADGFILESGNGVLLEKCTADHNAGSGFNCGIDQLTISACVCEENAKIGINLSSNNAKIVNSIINSNGNAGLVYRGKDSLTIVNNLFVNNGLKGEYCIRVNDQILPAPAKMFSVNNIFAFNYCGIFLGGFVILENEDYNIYWSRDDAEIVINNRIYTRDEINSKVWYEETGQGKNSRSIDPLFVNLQYRDYRLARNSPAIDRGTGAFAPDKDIDGNIRPQGRGVDIGPYEAAEGSIVLPIAVAPKTPGYSSDISGTLDFCLDWGVASSVHKVVKYCVQVRDGLSGNWQNWLMETPDIGGVFSGMSDHTYYFRAKARDILDNWGDWSGTSYTIVPMDDQNPLIRYSGEWSTVVDDFAYLNTLHYSSAQGDYFTLKFNSSEVAWIGVKGPDRGQAKLYLDGELQQVDLYSGKHQYRIPIFKAILPEGVHELKVEVSGTKNKLSAGFRVDLDGIAIKR
jgi:hypothetical protein